MKRFHLYSCRNVFFLGLCTFANFSFATESIDCGGEPYSIQIHCGSESCATFSLYKGSERQAIENWLIQTLQVNFQLQTIVLVANDASNQKNSIQLSAKGKNGSLAILSLNTQLNCNWSAFTQ